MFILLVVFPACFYGMKAKGLANDLTVPITNSTEDAESLERPERVAGIGPGRSLVDPPVKIHASEAFPRPLNLIEFMLLFLFVFGS